MTSYPNVDALSNDISSSSISLRGTTLEILRGLWVAYPDLPSTTRSARMQPSRIPPTPACSTALDRRVITQQWGMKEWAYTFCCVFWIRKVDMIRVYWVWIGVLMIQLRKKLPSALRNWYQIEISPSPLHRAPTSAHQRDERPTGEGNSVQWMRYLRTSLSRCSVDFSTSFIYIRLLRPTSLA